MPKRSMRTVFLAARAAYLRELIDEGARPDDCCKAINLEGSAHVRRLEVAIAAIDYNIEESTEQLDSGGVRSRRFVLTESIP